MKKKIKIMYMFLCYVYNKAFKENSYRYSTASDFKRKKITHTIQKYKKKIFFRTYKLKSLSGQSFPEIIIIKKIGLRCTFLSALAGSTLA